MNALAALSPSTRTCSSAEPSRRLLLRPAWSGRRRNWWRSGCAIGLVAGTLLRWRCSGAERIHGISAKGAPMAERPLSIPFHSMVFLFEDVNATWSIYNPGGGWPMPVWLMALDVSAVISLSFSRSRSRRERTEMRAPFWACLLTLKAASIFPKCFTKVFEIPLIGSARAALVETDAAVRRLRIEARRSNRSRRCWPLRLTKTNGGVEDPIPFRQSGCKPERCTQAAGQPDQRRSFHPACLDADAHGISGQG